jgi:hypothetical protein
MTPRNIFRKAAPWVAGVWAALSGSAHATLNDSGVGANQCYDVGSNLLVACAGSSLPRQDGHLGRDADSATNTNKDGALGFSFARVCHSGQRAGSGNCPAKPKLGDSAKRWGCTEDLLTGLIWELKTTSGPRSSAVNHTNYSPEWDPLGEYGSPTDATGYVAQVNATGLCGASDWRLPTVTELHSIAHLGGVPIADGADGVIAIDTAWFPNTVQTRFWALEAFVLNAGNHWTVDTNSGRSSNETRATPRQVRLVRQPGSTLAPRYTVSPDGTEVSDSLQNLVWRRCPEGRILENGQCTGGSTLLYSHEAALLRAASEANSTGLPWRLPNAKELAAIAELSTSKPATDSFAFPNTPQLKHWTSTPEVFSGGTSAARVVDFFQGYMQSLTRQSAIPIRLVRDGP